MRWLASLPPIPDAAEPVEPVIVWLVLAAAVASAFAVLWRLVLRTIVRSIRSAVELVNANLVHNGGESLLDKVEESADLSRAALEQSRDAQRAADRAAERAEAAEERVREIKNGRV